LSTDICFELLFVKAVLRKKAVQNVIQLHLLYQSDLLTYCCSLINIICYVCVVKCVNCCRFEYIVLQITRTFSYLEDFL